LDNSTNIDLSGFDIQSNLTMALRLLGDEAVAGAKAKGGMSWSTFFMIYMVI